MADDMFRRLSKKYGTNSAMDAMSNIISQQRAVDFGSSPQQVFQTPFDQPQQPQQTRQEIPEQSIPQQVAQPGQQSVAIPEGNIHINDQFINGKMYNSYTGLSGNKAYRNNNPGNISGMSGLGYGASKIMHSKHGDKGDQKQLAFKDAASGWRGMNTLMSQKNYNNAPIRSAFSKYQSDQKAWGNMLSSMEKKGINVNGTFNQLSPEQKIIFMNDRARHEGWTGNPLTYNMLYGGN